MDRGVFDFPFCNFAFIPIWKYAHLVGFIWKLNLFSIKGHNKLMLTLWRAYIYILCDYWIDQFNHQLNSVNTCRSKSQTINRKKEKLKISSKFIVQDNITIIPSKCWFIAIVLLGKLSFKQAKRFKSEIKTNGWYAWWSMSIMVNELQLRTVLNPPGSVCSYQFCLQKF